MYRNFIVVSGNRPALESAEFSFDCEGLASSDCRRRMLRCRMKKWRVQFKGCSDWSYYEAKHYSPRDQTLVLHNSIFGKPVAIFPLENVMSIELVKEDLR
jgi:hypothetical protein